MMEYRQRAGAPPTARNAIRRAHFLATRGDTAAWYRTLSVIRRDSEQYKLGLHEADPCILVGGNNIFQVGGPYVNFSANAGASDEALLAQFNIFLNELRKQVPLPMTGRGKGSASRVGPLLFRRWRDACVVEYAHLLIWRAKQFDQGCISDVSLARWINRDEPKAHATTKKVLTHALDCLPMLAAELELEVLIKDEGGMRRDYARRISRALTRDPWTDVRRADRKL